MIKVNVINKNSYTVILEINVSEEKINEKRKYITEIIRERSDISGFRKGKAPVSIVSSVYKEEIEKKTVEDLVKDSLSYALRKNNLNPITKITIDDFKFLGNSLSFKGMFEIIPEIKLTKYKGIKIKVEKPEVGEKEVTNVLNVLRERNAEYVSDKSKSVENTDMVIVDMTGFSDNKEVEKLNSKNTEIYMESDVFPEIKKGLYGAKVNEEKKVDITIPSDYIDAELRGKKVSLKINIKDIKAKRLPEINDDFAKDVSKHKSITEFKKEILQKIKKEEEEKYKENVKKEIIKKLVASCDFEVPTSLVNKEFDRLMHNFEENIKKSNKTYDKEEAKKNFTELARNRVKGSIILEKIALQEKLMPSKEEVNKFINDILSNPKASKQLKDHFDSKLGREQVEYDLTIEKTLNFLFESANIIK